MQSSCRTAAPALADCTAAPQALLTDFPTLASCSVLMQVWALPEQRTQELRHCVLAFFTCSFLVCRPLAAPKTCGSQTTVLHHRLPMSFCQQTCKHCSKLQKLTTRQVQQRYGTGAPAGAAGASADMSPRSVLLLLLSLLSSTRAMAMLLARGGKRKTDRPAGPSRCCTGKRASGGRKERRPTAPTTASSAACELLLPPLLLLKAWLSLPLPVLLAGGSSGLSDSSPKSHQKRVKWSRSVSLSTASMVPLALSQPVPSSGCW